MLDQRLQGAANRTQGQVAGHQVVAGHLQQGLRHRFAVAGQARVEHQSARLADFFLELGAFADFAPKLGQRRLTGRVVLHQRHLVHELVTGGAVGQPVLMQVLVDAEDFLDVDREVLHGGFHWPSGEQAVDPSAQFAAVTTRVGQAIDMVDAQAIDQAAFDQLEQLRMSRLEHHRTLNARAAQFIDVEEAPPVDVVGSGAPAGQAVALPFEQLVQAMEALLTAAVEGGQGWLQRGAGVDPAGQFGVQRLGVDQRLRRTAQGSEVLGQVLQLWTVAEDLAVIGRADREAVIVMSNFEHAGRGIEGQRQFAVLQGLAIIAAEKRQQQLTGQQRIGGVPLDVEEFGVGAASAPGQQALPPGVVGATDGHVVGHGVENEAHAVLAQGGNQAQQSCLATQLRVDLGRVDHVIAMT
ncbi:hypothetical protein PS623_03883 [Pseudomonas fluorescens]|nr:hypothetical protein PS623_03883 [Pseudomonas fluorescens]